jgi:hypothetical protein
MYQAIDPTATETFSLDWDSGESPSIFMIGVVDSSLMAYIEDSYTTYRRSNNGSDSDSDIKLNLNRKNWNIVRFGLKGWTNVGGKKGGQEAKFETEKVKVPGIGEKEGLTEACMRMLSTRAISSLANRIRAFSELTEPDAKN